MLINNFIFSRICNVKSELTCALRLPILLIFSMGNVRVMSCNGFFGKASYSFFGATQ